MSPIVRPDGAATTTTTTTPAPTPATTTTAAPYRVGSYGVPSIDRWDSLFVAASAAVERKKRVRVDPRVLKAMMGVESGDNGAYPVDRCRPSDGFPGPRSCGPMQIKWPYHAARCPECDQHDIAGNIEMAGHIIGDTMLAHRCDEYEAYVRGYLTSDDINGTSQQAAVAGLKRRVAAMRRDAEGAGPTATTTTTPAPVDPWRPYPFPPARLAIVEKPYDGAGFDRSPLRRDLIRYLVTHITDGVPYEDARAIEWYRRFFGTGGERARDALVDLVCARDGTLGVLNDWRDPNAGGTRAGWANGGVDGIEGEGAAAYRAFPNVNVNGLSCENVSTDGRAWTDAMIRTNVALRVWLAVKLKVPASAYPIVPGAGYSMDVTHGDFSTKRCAGDPYRWGGLRDEIRKQTVADIRSWTGGATPPVPTPEPAFTKYGFSIEDVREFFNVIVRFNPDGTTDTLTFNEQGALSLFWLKRCEREGVFPEGNRIWFADAAAIPGVETWASFANGWTAFLPAGDRAAWTWLDEWAPQ